MSIDESAAAPVVDETIDTTLSEDQLDDVAGGGELNPQPFPPGPEKQ